MRSIEITTKELLVCLIFSILVISGFIVINSKYVANDQDKISEINRAIIIPDINQFIHAKNTDAGFVIAPFKIESFDGSFASKFSEVKGQYLAIKKVKERWTIHTYTTTDGKGHITVHTYYSWDYVDKEIDSPDLIKFNTIDIPYESIDNQNWRRLEISPETINEVDGYIISGNYVKKRYNSNVRWYYEVLPSVMTGSFFGYVSNKFPRDLIKIYENITPEDLSVKLVSDIKSNNTYRWIFVIVVVLIISGIFCYKENRWLNWRH